MELAVNDLASDWIIHPVGQHITHARVVMECRAKAASLIRARSRRGKFFEISLFSEPAWDILLELFVAYVDHKRLQASAIGIDAHVPQTTTIRWLRALADRGFIEREDDPLDGRRCFVSLSEDGALVMMNYFKSLGS